MERLKNLYFDDSTPVSRYVLSLGKILCYKFEPNFFHNFIGFEFRLYRIFIVLNVKCIHVVFTILRHFNKSLFLVNQPGEMLLNLFFKWKGVFIIDFGLCYA